MAERPTIAVLLEDKLKPWIRSAGVEFMQTWDDIGLCEDVRINRLDVVVEHVKTLLGEMLTEESNLKTNILLKIKEWTEAIAQISIELDFPNYAPQDGLTVLQLEKELRTKIEELTMEKHKRLQKLKKLRHENLLLSSSLGVEPFFIPNVNVPSEELIAQLETHTKALIAEKDNRLKTFYATKNLILDLYRELERGPTFKEKSLYNDENLILSIDTLEKLNNLQEELMQLNKDKQSHAIILRESLAKLWDRLQVEQCDRDKFLTLYPGHKPTTIKALKEEIEKLKQLQRQNIEKFVISMRQELVSLWDKCFFGSAQRDIFGAFHDDSYSEELLDLHILEVEKLKSFFDENKDLLNKWVRRNQLWNKMLDFEKKASDPNRFNNRGGNLLLEEKERKKLLKDLPKLEHELETLVLGWETSHGTIFCINGERLVDIMNTEWEKYRSEKEAEKAERQKAKTKQIEDEMYKGSKILTPAKRKMETPKSARKRFIGDQSSMSRTVRIHSSISRTPGSVRRFPRSAKTGNKPPISRRRKSRTAPSGTVLGRSEVKENFDNSNCSVVNTTSVSLASTVLPYANFTNRLTHPEGIFNSTSMNPSSS